jgi:hypothetical protein
MSSGESKNITLEIQEAYHVLYVGVYFLLRIKLGLTRNS